MRLGVLDIGSNTVHLLLVDAHPGARPVPFASHKRPLSLIAYLDDDGAITEAGQRELIGFVAEAGEFARRHRAQDLLSFCTSAIREAPNGAAVLARVEAETTVRLKELSGADEASLTFLAVRRWYGWGAGTLLDLDIGGGSFEMAQGADELPETALSLPLGAGRLTRDWLPGDPPTAKSIKKLRKHIRAAVQEAAAEFAACGRPNLAVGTSKTFRSLARITGAAPSAAGPYVRRQLQRTDLGLWTKRLETMSISDRSNLDGVSPIRASQVLAGAMTAHAAMEAFDLPVLEICPWALREGLILQRFDTLRFESDGPLPDSPLPDSRLPERVPEMAPLTATSTESPAE
ncbi:Ppx/GppA family phosphatase [Arthrobacter sp. zg-Y820]|uniref:Ppx/GppA phosphatase family protein n=1 Tax=unclassified Arthrobacter TaxID=235627 RepID=UPI001E4C8D14|nr:MULTISPECIES: Ppx/GppA family phosphatase [unclassified Arthrobacter]MCC9195582.1 Ppx/GppA family phosphatase [Arthrobacter sp. zg-Y820]MDK1278441.1 Ppx/GppA family phosphatase [Arthrobacter sp. zg.Y820]MDK1359954.1 Ppx/GppA family phosphatase [Arthrobacter sp. zg-Y1219]WIB09119.1 Ppx/GppA family phosphatase [Arthrobacter sp. zg-Y820]